MKALADMLGNFFDTISTVLDFVFGLFEDLLFMIQLLGKFVVNLPSYFSWLPGPVVSVILVIFSIVVIYKILGREG